MALLDTASLIVTPNGYKASKLYSIVPSDGTGDMTMSRTGNTATRVNSSGLIETVNANIPRLDYLGSTCPKLLLEPQRTNLLNYSELFENSYWTKTNITITANSTTAPDGNTTADTFNATNTTFNILRRTVTTTIGTVYTSSIFVKKNNYRYIGMRALYAGSDTFNFYDFDTNTITNAGSTSNPLKVENYGNGWFRLSQTSTATLTSHLFDVGYVNSSGNNAALPAGTEKYYVWGAQIEAGSFATSYIPTTTASVTRNPDSLGKSNVYTNGYISSFGGTWFIDLANNNGFTRDSAKIGMWIGESNSNSINVGFSSFNIRTLSGTAQKLQISFYNGTIGTTLYQTTQVNAKIAITFNGTTANIFVNGTKVVTSASAEITLANFQYFNFQEDVPFNIKSTALFNSPLSDTNCISLTTL